MAKKNTGNFDGSGGVFNTQTVNVGDSGNGAVEQEQIRRLFEYLTAAHRQTMKEMDMLNNPLNAALLAQNPDELRRLFVSASVYSQLIGVASLIFGNTAFGSSTDVVVY